MIPARLFILLVISSGAGGLLGSVLGGAFGRRGLFAGGVVGGLLACAVAAGIAARLRWIESGERTPTAAGAMAGFLAAVAVAVNTLQSPVGPVLSTLLVGIGGLAGRGWSRSSTRRHDMSISFGQQGSPSRAAQLGLLLAAPAIVFVAANLLNEVGIPLLYNPIEALLSAPGRREAFNLISPALFVVAPAIALALNLFAIARLDLRWERRQLVSTVTITPYVMNVAVLAAGGLALGALLTYLFVENFSIVLRHLG